MSAKACAKETRVVVILVQSQAILSECHVRKDYGVSIGETTYLQSIRNP